jgi:TPR repeat protein
MNCNLPLVTPTSFFRSTASVNSQKGNDATAQPDCAIAAFSEKFFEAEIDGDIGYALEIKQVLESDNPINYCNEEIHELFAPVLKTEETRIAALQIVCYIIGKMYRDGVSYPLKGIARDITDLSAVQFFEKAARGGHKPALDALKEMYLEGRGLTQKSYWEGDPPILSYLAIEILKASSPCHSLELPSDTGNAIANEFLKELFYEKDPRASYQLGIFYGVINGNKALAKGYIKEAAMNQTDPDVLCRLGECHLEGNDSLGVKKNEERAEKLLSAAVDKGSERARTLLEEIYLKRSDKLAFDYFSKDHGKRNPAALYKLGLLYEKGCDGVAKDLKEARKLFEKAADIGSPEASFKLAELNLHENESIQNCDKNDIATSYLLQAAIQGHPKAAYIIGMQYLKLESKSTSIFGARVDHTVMSYSHAEKYFTIAHKAGYAAATYQLVLMHEQGMFVEMDKKANAIKAVTFFREAALAGVPDAMCKLGELFLNGFSVENVCIVEQSFDEAKKCFAKAADQGHAKAAFLFTRWHSPSLIYEDRYHKPKKNYNRDWVLGTPLRTKKDVVAGKWFFPTAVADFDQYKLALRGRSSAYYQTNLTQLCKYVEIAIKGEIPGAYYLRAELFSVGNMFYLTPWAENYDEAERDSQMYADHAKARDLGYTDGKFLLRGSAWDTEQPGVKEGRWHEELFV